jgi:hypothetical protein
LQIRNSSLRWRAKIGADAWTRKHLHAVSRVYVDQNKPSYCGSRIPTHRCTGRIVLKTVDMPRVAAGWPMLPFCTVEGVARMADRVQRLRVQWSNQATKCGDIQ